MIAVPDDRIRFGDSLRERPGNIVGPVIPGEAGTLMLALQLKFEESEYWPPEQMREHQLRQVASLAVHAHEFSPLLRSRFDRGNTSGSTVQSRQGVYVRLVLAEWAKIP